MDYAYVRAWGQTLGSFPYYIEGEVEKARRSNAPETAIYQRDDGSWATFEGIASKDTRNAIAALASKLMSEDAAKGLIEQFAEKQGDGHFACPRCGRMAMDDNILHNAQSRRVEVYVCDACGMLEGIEDMPKNFKLPLSAWAITKNPTEWGMPLQLTFVGHDSWSRPVYKCGGRLYVDVDPKADRKPEICTKQGNDFDGEPCDPLPEGTEVEFIPCRDTW